MAKPAEPTASEPADTGDTEPVLLLTSDAAVPDATTSTDIALQELKTEVLSAVRGAITGVMSRHQPQHLEAELDLDFSLREPEWEPAPHSEPQSHRECDFGEPVPGEATALDLKLEPAFVPIARGDAYGAPQIQLPALPGLVESTKSGVVALQHSPAVHAASGRSRPLPAWTTAALLSMTGVAAGAIAAILLVDPIVTADIRQILHDRFRILIAEAGGVEEAGTARDTLAQANSADAPARTDATGSLETDAAADAGPRLVDRVATAPTRKTTGAPAAARVGWSLGAPQSDAPAAAATRETPAELENASQSAAPDVAALTRAVRVAAIGNAATFTHAIEVPIGASAALRSAGHLSGLEILAALPAPAAVAAPVESGSEPGAANAKLDLTQKSLKGEAVPPAAVAPKAPATPFSAMARANEALSRGDIETARMLLQSESEAGQVEAMLALARTFDPNYLQQIGVAPSKGQAAVAEKLYRAWYERSVELGLVSKGVDLRRLIRAMARAKP